ncbi:hypothetical protein PFISCL1PPCAC_28035, partial [Pristionchus fissidentatus]
APATDANVFAALNLIFDKSGHKPSKNMTEVLKSDSMRANHPIRIKDRDGETHYITPRGRRKQDMKTIIYDPEEITFEGPPVPGVTYIAKSHKKETYRYQQKIHRKKRQMIYEKLGETVPKGRPKVGEAELLKSKMAELEKKQSGEVEIATGSEEATVYTGGEESSSASEIDDADVTLPPTPTTPVSPPIEEHQPAEQPHFTVPHAEVKRSSSDMSDAFMDVRHFYETAAGRPMTPVKSPVMVDDGEGYVDEVERLENETAEQSGFLLSPHRPSKRYEEERRQGDEEEERRKIAEHTKMVPKKKEDWRITHPWRVDKKGRVV